MANTGFKGLDVRQTGNQLVFRSLLQDSGGVIVATGTSSLRLYELQSDGTLKSYDFNDNTFKTTALTTETLAMTHRTGNNATTNTGLWTVVLSTLTGFTTGGIYLAHVTNTGAAPAVQVREFQYGSAEGDLAVTAAGTGSAYVQSDVKDVAGTAQTARDLGAQLDAAVSTRLATSGYTAPDNADVVAIRAKTDNLPASPAAVGSAMTLDPTQAVPTSNTANTLGDCLNAARAQGFGKWVIDTTAKTLTLYAPDGTTAVRVFTLDSVTVPKQRV